MERFGQVWMFGFRVLGDRRMLAVAALIAAVAAALFGATEAMAAGRWG